MFEKTIARLDNYFWTQHNVPNRMNESHLVSHKVLLIIRCILCAYTSVVIFLQTKKIANMGAYYEFLTFWGILSVHWYFVFTVIEMISFRKNQNKSYYPSVWKFTHYLFEFAFCTQFLIVLVFWTVIVPALGSLSNFGGANIALNSQLHGGFFLAILIDMVINNIQFIKSHLIITCALTTVYGCVNIFYTLNWEPVYPGITWDNAKSYLIMGVGFAIFYMQYYIATLIFQKWKLKRIEAQSSSYAKQSYYL